MRIELREDSPFRVLLPLLLFAVLAAVGCESRRFDAESLPQQLMAKSLNNPQTIDLSRLAGSSVSSELIAPGDILEITIAAGLSESRKITFPARVADNGYVSLPVIGPVEVADLELPGAEAVIRSSCVQQGLYKAPHVTVSMKRQRLNRITVVGAVEEPGIYSLPRKSSNLLAAIVQARGLANDAGENVEIRMPNTPGTSGPGWQLGPVARAGHSPGQASRLTPGTDLSMRSLQVNLVSAAREGTGGYELPDGAVVMVERRDPIPIQVIGLVNEQGSYKPPVGKDYRLLDAIANAGGLSNSVADKIYVIRSAPGRTNPAVIEISFARAKESASSNLLLQAGDIVSVEQTPATVLLDTIKLMNFGFGASARIF